MTTIRCHYLIVELTKKDKILILIASCLFFGRVLHLQFAIWHGIPEDRVLYANLVEFVTYLFVVALFALLVSVVTKMELTKRDKILASVILCLLLVHVIHGMLDHLSVLIYHHGLYTVFTDYGFIMGIGLFVLFVFSWVIMILTPINLVLEHALIWDKPPYIICCILAWISLFVLIRYTKGMKLIPRIAYLYLIPALVMSLAYLFYLPLH
jgi:hypothetical protein